jgi:hypothetical protein
MSSASPSIKGSGISSLIEDVAKMRDDGRAPAALLEERLTPADRRLLDEPVNLAGWYDIHCYRRLAELVCEIEGRREDLLRERGAAAAERLAAAGLYQQMETVTRMRDDELEGDDAFRAYGRLLRLIVTLSGSMLNFSRFTVEIDSEHEDRYCIHILEAEEFPDVLTYTTEGFINAMARMGSGRGRNDSWLLDRSDGQLRYRMTRPV